MGCFISIEMGVTITMLIIFSLADAISSPSSLLTDEGEALRNTGWWNSTSPAHCDWAGVSCNKVGSVTEIDISLPDKELGELSKLNFSSFPNLVELHLYGCKLNGSIPHQIGTLTSLTYLDLSSNDLTGELPLSLANLTQLQTLFLYSNRLHGSIPLQIGTLANLSTLYLSSNNLTGELPLSLANLTQLQTLSLSSNRLHGSIPLQIGTLSNLSTLYLSSNNLTGELPLSLANLIQLRYLSLYSNRLHGSVPPDIGKMKNLISLDLGNNHLSGVIPSLLRHLTKLEYLYLDGNQINGSIPFEIGHLENLRLIFLNNNNLTGVIPFSLGSLTNLTYLSLERNHINGFIPLVIGKMKSLRRLQLSYNHLSGVIPSSLGNLTNLTYLNLESNHISGFIPPEIGKMKSLISLALSYNHLNGVIPSSLGNLTHLTSLTLQGNQIGGFIPTEIENLEKLSTLDMSNNLLSGQIPFQLGNLKEVIYFNLSYNNLSGTVPHSISNNIIWTSIDYSHNPFEDQSRAPRYPLDYNKRHQISILIFAVSIFATLMLSIVVLGFLFHKRRIKKNQSVETTKVKNGDLFSIWDYDGVIAYQDIIRATEDFDIKYCIGTGGYGSVYRAQLPSGRVVALKKLHGWESENPAYLKSFENEVQMLSTIQHRNIVKLHGFCLQNRCMFLVYKYMERGSLFCMLRDEVEAMELDWVKRVTVVKGIANALSYMHHDCALPIIHRDISSNNILLDSNLEAFVSDFGTARLLDPDSSNQTLIVGTYGYIAPGKQLNNNLH